MIVRLAVGFAAGYVLGTRAGRERYAEIKALARQVAARLEQTGTQGDHPLGPLREGGSSES